MDAADLALGLGLAVHSRPRVVACLSASICPYPRPYPRQSALVRINPPQSALVRGPIRVHPRPYLRPSALVRINPPQRLKINRCM